ncbi:MAG: preprotein translocase subunit SecE [Bdellovibrionales bacterium]
MDEKNTQNITNFAFVAAGFLAYFVVAVLFDTLAGAFGAVARLRNVELAQHGIPVAVGLITFLALFMNKRAHAFMEEVVVEVSKVVWPSRKDTVAMTIVCCVMVVVAGLGLGAFDFLSSQLIKVFVN